MIGSTGDRHSAVAGWRIPLGGATALFAGRQGGLSPEPWDSLNVGWSTADDPERITGNIELLRRAADPAIKGIVTMQQVHGAGVRRAEGPSDPPVEADAQITAVSGLGLLAVSADCLPIVIASASEVAVVHVGWRGLAAGILDAALDSFASASTPGTLKAALGPCAGACCYEVGDEVFRAIGKDAISDGARIDLQGTAASRLSGAGVDVVARVGACTICDRERRFFSHRADGTDTGRQGALAWLNS